MIGVINTQRCNLASVLLAVEKLNLDSQIINNPKEIDKCSKLILPGVGSFGASSTYIQNSGLASAIVNAVNGNKIPILGICLGMQLLFPTSEESKGAKGLSLLSGSVKYIPTNKLARIPHIGWEETVVKKPSLLFSSVEVQTPFYFSHSYFCAPERSDVSTSVIKGTDICASVQYDHIFGVQFHPEKSHKMGLEIIKKFLERK